MNQSRRCTVLYKMYKSHAIVNSTEEAQEMCIHKKQPVDYVIPFTEYQVEMLNYYDSFSSSYFHSRLLNIKIL